VGPLLSVTVECARSRLGALAAGAAVVACCLVGPLLVGAACVLAIGVVGELAAVACLLVLWGVLLWRVRAGGRC
jgi:hypothetical protein